MKKSAILVLYLVSFLFLPTIALASVNVEISNNDEGSKNSVVVNSTTGGKTSSNSSSSIKTDIRIESNGEVKEYHSEGDEDINLESSDGNSKVKINSNSNTNSTSSPSASPNESEADEDFNLVEFLKAQLSLIKLINLFNWL